MSEFITGGLRASFAAILLGASLMGAASGIVPVSSLMLQSDLIVAAESTGGSDTGSEISINISVIRVLKGAAEPGQVFAVRWQSPTNRFHASLDVGRHTGLFFLHKEGPAFTPIPVVAGEVRSSDLYLPLPPGNLPPQRGYDAATGLPDKVAAELSAATEAMDSNDLALGLLYLEGLESTKAADLIGSYRQLAASSSPHAAAIGLAGLVRNSDPAAPGRIKTEFQALSKSAHFGLAVGGICNYYRTTNSDALAALTNLATDQTGEISLRRCSAHALRAVHTKESLASLRQLLDNADQITRYEAVFGLAAFANNLPMQVAENTANQGFLKSVGDGPFTTVETKGQLPSLPEFRANEARYVTLWKEWWTQVHGKL